MRRNKSGFQRNDAKGKVRIDLIPTWVLERLGTLYADGAERFGERNWEKANSQEDYVSFEASFCRHGTQFRNGAKDEDHFARTMFNLIGMEHVNLLKK